MQNGVVSLCFDTQPLRGASEQLREQRQASKPHVVMHSSQALAQARAKRRVKIWAIRLAEHSDCKGCGRISQSGGDNPSLCRRASACREHLLRFSVTSLFIYFHHLRQPLEMHVRSCTLIVRSFVQGFPHHDVQMVLASKAKLPYARHSCAPCNTV